MLKNKNLLNEYNKLTNEQKEQLAKWIEKRVKPFKRKRYNDYMTGYRIKYYYEYETGIKISERQFIAGLILAGFEPKEHENELYYKFQVSEQFITHHIKLLDDYGYFLMCKGKK